MQSWVENLVEASFDSVITEYQCQPIWVMNTVEESKEYDWLNIAIDCHHHILGGKRQDMTIAMILSQCQWNWKLL